MAVLRDTEALKTILSELDFPAGKDDIVAHAEGRGASRETLSGLRAIPSADYSDAGEVLRSVPTAATPRPRPGTGQARRRRTHGRSDAAEQARDTEENSIESDPSL
ncbi:DUF2795 domain-containing protein [Actinorugispora endophytica]|uniref:Uncharacterized protein DUF2795 n=1 Tax=Actinorugispora endophytica TaxID=1605990 RepID=A0A4V3D8L8_9ACTN|nr:DUF2795 domain-containing protein [Actinorugispora endophytica]TDQ52286.1 uncharacterized protein DUF2795 [Actinorugispora endophytica]